jgi:hypothetical protein
MLAEWFTGFDPAVVEAMKAAAVHVTEAARLPQADDEARRPTPRAKVVRASELKSQPVEWLWRGRVPLGMLTMFSGDPKLGKSLVTLAMAAAVTQGVPLPGDTAQRRPGRVFLLSAEDDAARTIIPRLRAAGADLDRVHLFSSILVPGVPAELGNPAGAVPSYERLPTLLEHDLAVLEDEVKRCGDGRLIVVDPVSAYLGGTDDHRNADLRAVLAPLKAMAERLGVAVVLVNHLSKGSGTNGKYRVMGSIAYVGTCRANFLFVRDRTDPTGRRVLFCDNGGNLAPPAPTLAYTIGADDEEDPFANFLDEPVAITAEQALVDEVEAGQDRRQAAERREAEQWLREFLAGGPVAATEILEAAGKSGFSKGTLRRARESLGVLSIREGFAKDARWSWRLPDPAKS